MDSGKRVGPILLKLKPPAKDDHQNGSSEEEEEEDDDDEQDDSGCGSEIDGGFKKKKVVVIGGDGRRGSAADVTPSLLQCQVDKCPADLTVVKTYYRRHKVCEGHSKAPAVVLAGLRQRFCQQCSRFHQLSEFDEARRSCRRRLAGHNERRRRKSSELGLKDTRFMRNTELQ